MRFARCTPPMQFYATAYARVSTCSANNKREMCSTVSRMSFQMRLLPTMRLACVCIFLLAHMSTSFASAGNTSAVSRMHSVMLQNVTSLSKEYQRLPLLGKCCPLNEILMKNTDEDSECVLVPPNDSSLVPFSPLFSPFNRTGILYPGDKVEEFVALIGSPCRYGRYMLYPEQTSDDDYYLMLNGSVFAPRHEPTMLAPGQDYCMEVVPEMGLRLLVCFPKENASPAADSRIIIYACGLLISVPFLILTIAAYTITPKLRDVHGKALCHYCGCLALAFTTLAITQLASAKLPPEVCISIAFVIQFSFVTCFFWLNVICIETWLLVRHHVNHRSYTRMHPKRLLFYYSIWAWIPPAILIVISIAMDLSPTIPMTYVKPTFGSESCWFKSDMEAMPYFYVPVSLLLLANIVLFVMTSVKITRYQQELARRRQERNENSNREDQRLFRRLKRTFFVCLVLFFLMGLNWTMELISWWVGGDPLDWSIFDLVNALQGLLIFGLFVMRRPVRDFIWHRVQKLRGIHAAEPEVGSMDLALLPMINSSHERGTTRLVA